VALIDFPFQAISLTPGGRGMTVRFFVPEASLLLATPSRLPNK
jgi:hypothetical protein